LNVAEILNCLAETTYSRAFEYVRVLLVVFSDRTIFRIQSCALIEGLAMQSGIGHSLRSLKSRYLLSALLLASFLAVSALPANAVTFAPIQPLTFTKGFGGADPLPQTITVNSVGPAFNFSISSVTTASGGTWLSTDNVSWNNCSVCLTPEHIRVIVSPGIALAAGVYTGQIVLASGAVTMTIPVTLTIAAAGTAFFDALPGAVNFSFKTGGQAPPSQSVPIRNGGSGTLNWTLTKTTADGGNWLNVSSTSGTAPSTVTFSVNKANIPGGGLTAGTFTGRILLQSSNGNVNIPVSVVVGDPVFSQVNAISFTKPFGGADPLPQTLTIASTGATFNYTASVSTSTGGNWLSVDNKSWNNCTLCATPERLSVIVNPSPTLAVGTYMGQVVLTSQDGHQSLTVPVLLTIADPAVPFFDNIAGEMAFTLQTGGFTPPTRQIQILNAGAGVLNWTVTAKTADGGNWLTVSPSSGAAPTQVTIGLAVPSLPDGGLTAGTFIGELVFEAPGSSVTVPVSVTVGPNVFNQLNEISFTKVFGGANPLPQTLTVATPGTTPFNYTVSLSTANGGNWLSVDNVSWNNCTLCATPETIRVIVNPSPTLAAGVYTGQILFTSQGGSQGVTVPVKLTVADASTAFFDNVPGQMSFSMKTGGSTPPSQPLPIRNGGSGTLSWTLATSTSDGRNWLTASAASGTAPSVVTISIVKANLPNQGLVAGTFTGEIVLQSAGSSVSVPVSVVVGDAVFEQVNAIAFTKPFGGADPLPQTLMVASTGATFNFTVTASTANGGNWLSVDNVSWNNCTLCATPETIRAIVSSSPTLAIGTYTGEIVFTSQNGQQAITVPVTLTVANTATAFLDNLPGQLAFSMKTGGSNPPSQPLQVRNAGTGALNWTLTQSTSDGGNWLTTSVQSGTAPSIINVSIVKANLPGLGLTAGTFTGEVVIQTAGSSATVPISVVVGADVFQQINPINFTMTAGGANPLPQALTIASAGADFNFTTLASTSNGGPWLTADNVSWNNCTLCGTPEVIVATVNASPTLPAGTYTGEIVFTSQNGAQAITVPVTLTVAPPSGPFFDDMPGEATFSFVTGSGSPATQVINVRNGGPGTLNWTLTTSTSDGGNWLTTSQTSGVAPAAVTIGVIAGSLPNLGLVAGTFTGEVVFQSGTGTVTVPVTVNVGADVFVQAPRVDFGKSQGGANPLSKTLHVASTATNFNFTIQPSTGTGGNWLTVTNTTSCVLCTTPRDLSVNVVASVALPAGVYTGQILFTEQAGRRSMLVPVELTVAGSGPITQLSSVTPNKGVPGQTLGSVTIIGVNTHFAQGSTGVDFGAGITVNGVTVTSSTSLTADITVQNSATLGNRDVTVSTGAEIVSLSNGFTITTVGPATHLLVLPHSFAVSGVPIQFTVTALDASDNPVLNYAGTVHFTSSDPSAVLPANSTLVSGAGTFSAVLVTPGARTITASDVAAGAVSGTSASVTVSAATGLRYIAVTPCRLVDTRSVATGGPFIPSGASKDFFPVGACGIPASAQAYSLNVAVVPHGPLGFLTVWPAGQTRATVATLNSLDGRIKSNAAIVPAGAGGAVSAFATNDTDVILDINGYFVPASDPAGLAFYPLPPCRLVDTRSNLLSSGAIAGGTSRTLPLLSSACGVPATARAYSLNFVVVPPGPLGFLTAYPTGVAQPSAATLNALTGTVTANAGIVPAGTGGSIDVFASNPTDLVVDINGYFAPPAAGGLSLYNLPPCRALDTRLPLGTPAFNGTKNIDVTGSLCGGTSAVKAYVFNSTVVPPAALGFLTLWPQGSVQPTVATLNALDAAITNNLAIVPTNNTQVSAFASNPTHLILDLFGYFAP
jgi:hypothetical protein